MVRGVDMYGLDIEIVDIENNKERKEVEEFLQRFQLQYEKDIDFTLVAREQGKIIATSSKAKNIIKAFAIEEKYRGQGISAALITKIIDKMFDQGIYHSFIFTKPENVQIFSGLNYKLIHSTEKAALLENGIYGINSYLNKVIKENNIDVTVPRGAIVMNCNPFTKGHEFLIEKASKELEEVIIFIVEEDKSDFSFATRYKLVKEGVSHLKNVKVIKGGEYIISQATFPSYFLKKEDDKLKVYTEMDAGIFGKYFCSQLNINVRYLGQEPNCIVTNAYNNTLIKELRKYGVEVRIVERMKKDETIISASKVRNLIKDEQYWAIEGLVPKVTWDFLNTSQGKETMKKIREKSSLD